MAERMISYREAIREALTSAMQQDPQVFLMGEDVGVYGGSFGVTKGMIDLFGELRIRDTPISEGAIMGTAIGAALQGMRPVIEVMFSDFISLMMDQLVNTAAKIHYMYGGQMSVPLVLRAASGSGTGAGSQHSQSLEAWLCHIPGLKVVVPSAPQDARGLLLSAILDNNPVIFLEQKLLYGTTGLVTEQASPIPLGVADLKQEGSDISLITYGRMVGCCLEAATQLAQEGILADVLDLRTLAPIDDTAILETACKTGRILIVHEACKTGGVGGEIAAKIVENRAAFAALKTPILRLCGDDTPIPFSKKLEQEAVPTTERIYLAAKKMLSE